MISAVLQNTASDGSLSLTMTSLVKMPRRLLFAQGLPLEACSVTVAGMPCTPPSTLVMCTIVVCFGLGVMQAGCESLEREEQARATARIDEAIALHKTAAAQVRLGDSKEKVLGLLEPTQFGLLSNEIKAPVAYPTELADGRPAMVEVFYFRSHRYPDERSTNHQGEAQPDDFTPYIFTDDVLTGIGWTNLLSLKIVKPPSHHHEQEACKELGPLAGCF